MAKAINHKQKILVLMDILEKHSDKEHPLSMPEILARLEERGIKAERKGIYTDIKALDESGFRIDKKKGTVPKYYHTERVFSLRELKLILDCVQASKFVNKKSAAEISGKAESLCSIHEAILLRRETVFVNRIKSRNQYVMKNLDTIQQAIKADCQITFNYFRYGVDKKAVYSRNGAEYIVSPFALLYSGEYYYLLAYEEEHAELRHYRVDRMVRIQKSSKSRVGREAYKMLDMDNHLKKTYSMFHGDVKQITMEFDNSLASVVIDRFGWDVEIKPVGESRFHITEDIAVSEQFFGWVFGLGHKAMIVSPQSVVDEFAELVAGIGAKYQR